MKYYFALTLLLGFKIGFSQVIVVNPDQKIKVFNADEAQDSVKRETTLKRVAHFGLLHPFRGRYPIFIEQALSGYFSIGAGIGFTYADFFKKEHLDAVTNSNNSKMGIGLFSDIQLKYYPKGLGLEEFYLAPNFRFSSFNLSQYDTNINQTFKTQERQYDYMIIAGTQFSDWSSVLVYDFYLGFGFSKVYKSTQELVNISGSFEPFDIVSSEQLKPILRLGIKMGVRLN